MGKVNSFETLKQIQRTRAAHLQQFQQLRPLEERYLSQQALRSAKVPMQEMVQRQPIVEAKMALEKDREQFEISVAKFMPSQALPDYKEKVLKEAKLGIIHKIEHYQTKYDKELERQEQRRKAGKEIGEKAEQRLDKYRLQLAYWKNFLQKIEKDPDATIPQYYSGQAERRIDEKMERKEARAELKKELYKQGMTSYGTYVLYEGRAIPLSEFKYGGMKGEEAIRKVTGIKYVEYQPGRLDIKTSKFEGVWYVPYLATKEGVVRVTETTPEERAKLREQPPVTIIGEPTTEFTYKEWKGEGPLPTGAVFIRPGEEEKLKELMISFKPVQMTTEEKIAAGLEKPVPPPPIKYDIGLKKIVEKNEQTGLIYLGETVREPRTEYYRGTWYTPTELQEVMKQQAGLPSALPPEKPQYQLDLFADIQKFITKTVPSLFPPPPRTESSLLYGLPATGAEEETDIRKKWQEVEKSSFEKAKKFTKDAILIILTGQKPQEGFYMKVTERYPDGNIKEIRYERVPELEVYEKKAEITRSEYLEKQGKISEIIMNKNIQDKINQKYEEMVRAGVVDYKVLEDYAKQVSREEYEKTMDYWKRTVIPTAQRLYTEFPRPLAYPETFEAIVPWGKKKLQEIKEQYPTMGKDVLTDFKALGKIGYEATKFGVVASYSLPFKWLPSLAYKFKHAEEGGVLYAGPFGIAGMTARQAKLFEKNIEKTQEFVKGVTSWKPPRWIISPTIKVHTFSVADIVTLYDIITWPIFFKYKFTTWALGEYAIPIETQIGERIKVKKELGWLPKEEKKTYSLRFLLPKEEGKQLYEAVKERGLLELGLFTLWTVPRLWNLKEVIHAKYLSKEKSKVLPTLTRDLTRENFLRKRAEILITDKSGNKYLMVKEKGGKWGLPGGAVKHETVRHALVRELREETGLKIAEKAKDLKFVGKYVSADEVHYLFQMKINNLRELMKTGKLSTEIKGYKLAKIQPSYVAGKYEIFGKPSIWQRAREALFGIPPSEFVSRYAKQSARFALEIPKVKEAIKTMSVAEFKATYSTAKTWMISTYGRVQFNKMLAAVGQKGIVKEFLLYRMGALPSQLYVSGRIIKSRRYPTVIVGPVSRYDIGLRATKEVFKKGKFVTTGLVPGAKNKPPKWTEYAVKRQGMIGYEGVKMTTTKPGFIKRLVEETKQMLKERKTFITTPTYLKYKETPFRVTKTYPTRVVHPALKIIGKPKTGEKIGGLYLHPVATPYGTYAKPYTEAYLNKFSQALGQKVKPYAGFRRQQIAYVAGSYMGLYPVKHFGYEFRWAKPKGEMWIIAPKKGMKVPWELTQKAIREKELEHILRAGQIIVQKGVGMTYLGKPIIVRYAEVVQMPKVAKEIEAGFQAYGKMTKAERAMFLKKVDVLTGGMGKAYEYSYLGYAIQPTYITPSEIAPVLGMFISRGVISKKEVPASYPFIPKYSIPTAVSSVTVASEAVAPSVVEPAEVTTFSLPYVPSEPPTVPVFPPSRPFIPLALPPSVIFPQYIKPISYKYEKKKKLPEAKGWIPLVKKKGKWKKIGPPMLKQKAIKLGERVTLQTLIAQFKIVPTKEQVIGVEMPYEPSRRLFRTYKIVKRRKIPLQYTWIQKRPERIKRKSEVIELHKKRREFYAKKKKKMLWL